VRPLALTHLAQFAAAGLPENVAKEPFEKCCNEQVGQALEPNLPCAYRVLVVNPVGAILVPYNSAKRVMARRANGIHIPPRVSKTRTKLAYAWHGSQNV
jgi:hypothetical protein